MDFMARFSGWSPQVLSIVRIMTALIFLLHGTVKLFGWPGPGPATLSTMYLAAALIELIGGVLLVGGLYTRLIAFICSGEMAFAYFIGHAPQNFWPILNRGDAAILYCFIFLYMAFAGGGAWSLDRSIRHTD